jgi:hypothetical protein
LTEDVEGIDTEDFIPLGKTVPVNAISQQWVNTDCGPAARDTLSFGKQLSKFQTNLPPSSSGYTNQSHPLNNQVGI